MVVLRAPTSADWTAAKRAAQTAAYSAGMSAVLRVATLAALTVGPRAGCLEMRSVDLMAATTGPQ